MSLSFTYKQYILCESSLIFPVAHGNVCNFVAPKLTSKTIWRGGKGTKRQCFCILSKLNQWQYPPEM